MLVSYNKTYQASYVNIANGLTGGIEKRYNDVEYYFQLKKTNAQLATENAELKTAIAAMLKSGDTSSAKVRSAIDSLYADSTGRRYKYSFVEAKVVNNSLTNENNYITIHRGSKDGVKIDMAVAGPQGVVGRVVAVSDNFSVVMSMLNHNAKVSAMLRKSAYTGIADWNGQNPNILTLHNLPKTIIKDIKLGDSVITSNLSGNFPPGLMVGRVLKVSIDPATNYLNISLRSATNFYTLQYVYVIKNSMIDEQRALEDTTAKKLQSINK